MCCFFLWETRSDGSLWCGVNVRFARLDLIFTSCICNLNRSYSSVSTSNLQIPVEQILHQASMTSHNDTADVTHTVSQNLFIFVRIHLFHCLCSFIWPLTPFKCGERYRRNFTFNRLSWKPVTNTETQKYILQQLPNFKHIYCNRIQMEMPISYWVGP